MSPVEPPPIPEPPPPPPPERPVDGGRIALTIIGSLAGAFVFSVGMLMLLAWWFSDSAALNTPRWMLMALAPLFFIAVAAAFASRRGWKIAAIVLWIYVGLATLLTAACGAMLSGGL